MGAAAQEVDLPPLITFSSDYGPTDPYVGICHLVIADIAPAVRVVDLVHWIPGIRAGSVMLSESVTFAPPGSVHMAVVDPGVGTARRAVVVVTGRRDLLVGPDNGLLMPPAEALGGAVEAFALDNPRYQLRPLSATFHGRDVFAPAAAHLALGVEPAELGRRLTTDLVRLPDPFVRVSDGVLHSDVERADWYGNLQLAATGGDLADSRLTGEVVVVFEGGEAAAVVGRTFAEAAPGNLVVYVDSAGHVAIAVNGGSARNRLQSPGRVIVKRKR